MQEVQKECLDRLTADRWARSMDWLVDSIEWGLNQLGLDGWDIQLTGGGVKACWPHGSFVVWAEDVPLGQTDERWLAQLKGLHEGIGRV